jgi:hypothetical protein
LVAGVRTVTIEAECLAPTLRAWLPKPGFRFLGRYQNGIFENELR